MLRSREWGKWGLDPTTKGIWVFKYVKTSLHEVGNLSEEEKKDTACLKITFLTCKILTLLTVYLSIFDSHSISQKVHIQKTIGVHWLGKQTGWKMGGALVR